VAVDAEPLPVDPLENHRHSQLHRASFSALEASGALLEAGDVGEVADDPAPEWGKRHLALGEAARRPGEPFSDLGPTLFGNVEAAVQGDIVVVDPELG